MESYEREIHPLRPPQRTRQYGMDIPPHRFKKDISGATIPGTAFRSLTIQCLSLGSPDARLARVSPVFVEIHAKLAD